jgi:hypothetical protein
MMWFIQVLGSQGNEGPSEVVGDVGGLLGSR